MNTPLNIRWLGQVAYEESWQKMKEFTHNRTDACLDELWVVEHPRVFTQGQAGKSEHVLNPGDIPIVQTDRGGQVTYHGPGQLVIYCLLNISRLKIGVRGLVCLIESSVQNILKSWGIDSHLRDKAPGVYVEGAKISALGLRFRRGCCYHGLSLNVSMDLEPFDRINPCGYEGLQVTQVSHLGGPDSIDIAANALIEQLSSRLGYTATEHKVGWDK
ncbi:lipoyl(octanoyl) transferase LipB [Piscirickettsia litoralis]|uniref:Octanoyltransferase n=1 Tax=Piscirickettsia litoralis TaxID=1891921 RepID=A0ABX3A1N2_9GAMM|nr:lipoyl(octanoyl) transferase LipB [Piscirickettsia litoralis]ODN42767.1 octanoyltransferase [Piscirickettsia litoralis]